MKWLYKAYYRVFPPKTALARAKAVIYGYVAPTPSLKPDPAPVNWLEKYRARQDALGIKAAEAGDTETSEFIQEQQALRTEDSDRTWAYGYRIVITPQIPRNKSKQGRNQ